jgi:hypothetical protein
LSLAPIVTRETNSGAGSRLGLRRRDVFVWAAVILFSNHLFGVVKELRSASPEVLVSDASSIGIFQCMAWYAIFRLLGASDAAAAARWQDAVIAAALSLLVLMPTSRLIWIAAAGLAIYSWIVGGGDAKLRAAATVIAALSMQEFWGHVIFNLVALPLLRVETTAVGMILGAFRPGTVWQDNVIIGPSGYGIVVYTGCSSFQ